MSGFPLYDRYLYRAFESFRAYNCVLDINTPQSMSSYMSISKTCVGCAMNWMHEVQHENSSKQAEAYLA